MARSDKLVVEIRRIADIIGKRPVMGHWPYMAAERDSELLKFTANFIESLDREITTIAELGHQLMRADL